MTCFRKLIVLFLAVIMTVTFVPVSFAAESGGGSGGGTFALAAIDQDGIVIEPCLVSYEEGDTIADALAACGHQFDGLEDDWIDTIDGHTDNYVRFYDGGAYDLRRPASEVQTALLFTVGEMGDPTNHLRLVKLLAEHEQKDAAIRKYGPVKKAYQAAKENLPTANSEKAGTLADDLTAAYAKYEAWISQEKTSVTIRPVQNGQSVSAHVTLTDSMENVYQKDGASCTFELLEETYSFSVTKDDKEVSGTIEVHADDQNITISPELPYGQWIGSIQIRDNDKEDAETVTEGDVTTAYILDTTYSPYITITPGADIPLQEDGTPNTKEYSVYSEHTSFNIGTYYGDESVSQNKVTWSSKAKRLVEVAKAGLEDTEVRLKVVHKDTESGYTQRQYRMLLLKKIPTLKGLTVTAGPNKLALDPAFSVRNTSYEAETIADTVRVSGASYVPTNDPREECGKYADGYSIQVAGTEQEEDGSVEVPAGTGNPITITVSGKNGLSSTYQLIVNKVESRTVEVTKPSAGTRVTMESGTGSILLPDEETSAKATFIVAPGEYSWITTEDEYYHAKGAVSVPAGTGTVQAEGKAPVKEELLSGIRMFSGTFNTAVEYAEADGKTFRWDDHQYAFRMSDFATTVYVQAQFDSGVTVKRGAYTMTTGYERAPETLKSGTKTILTRLVKQGTANNQFVLTASRESGNITYYQDYEIRTRRFPTLDRLSVTDQAGNPLQIFANGDESETEFDSDIMEYTVNIGETAEGLNLTAGFSNPEMAAESTGDMTVTIDGQSFAKSGSGETVSKAVALDPSKSEETIDITLSDENEENPDSVYHLKVVKIPPVAVTFDITPKNGTVYVTDNISGVRILPEKDGSFPLLKGFGYTYTATCYGYVGKRGEVKVTEDTTVRVALDEAPVNSAIDPTLSAEWPYFRADLNNNGVVSHKVPNNPDDTVLYWANQAGEGWDSSAIGCPILADGYLYTYSAGKILKMDPVTGAIVKEGEMYTASSYAINCPTYAEGMIFIGLQNGTVQAFNAKTLESLWIYKDILGGQPNCQLTYKDGYLYTGFWNSETKKANFACISVTDENPNQAREEKLPVWTHTGNGFYWAGAYAGEDFVIVGSDDGAPGYTKGYGVLLSLDPKTGEILDKIHDQFVGDIRSSICYEEASGKCYFVSKSGQFCSVKVNDDGTFVKNSITKLQLYGAGAKSSEKAMSTSTPVVHNGRAYVGVSAGGVQFSASGYGGFNITVIDLTGSKPVIAYKVETKGYPQTSGLLTTAYDEGDGTVYVYFVDNERPGKIRVIKDKPGQTEPDPETLAAEEYEQNGTPMTCQAAKALFTPYGDQEQYAICSPISDEWGIIYFKNDSGNMMMIGPKITKLTVTEKPVKTEYRVGDLFDPRGLKVEATYANGKKRDVTQYIRYTTDPLTAEDTEIDLLYDIGSYMKMYQDQDGQPGAAYTVPQASVTVKIKDAGFVPTPIANLTLSQTEFDYTGSEQRPEVSLYNGETKLVENTDYVVTWPESSKEAGTYTVTVEGTGNYTGVLSAQYTIREAKQPERITSVDLTQTEFVYNGSDQRPEIRLINKSDMLKEGVDYTVTWPETSAAVGTYLVTVNGIGDYIGSATAEYTIREPEQKIEITSVELTATDFYFNNETQRPRIRSINGSGLLTEGTDYTVTWPSESTDAGTYEVTVTGIGAFTGTVTVTYTIHEELPPDPIESVTLSKTRLEFNGKEQRPSIRAINGNEDAEEGVDYLVEWPAESIYLGTYTVKVTGIGRYSGTIEVKYEIVEVSEIIPLKTVELSSLSFTYNGQAQRPFIRSVNGNYLLTEGKDYTVTWPEDPASAGTYTVTVTGIGAYEGTVNAAYTIEKAANKLTVKPAKKKIKKGKKFLVKASCLGGAKITVKVTSGKKNVKLLTKGSKVYIQGKKKGKAVVTVTAKAVTNYKKSVKKIKVTVQ